MHLSPAQVFTPTDAAADLSVNCWEEMGSGKREVSAGGWRAAAADQHPGRLRPDGFLCFAQDLQVWPHPRPGPQSGRNSGRGGEGGRGPRGGTAASLSGLGETWEAACPAPPCADPWCRLVSEHPQQQAASKHMTWIGFGKQHDRAGIAAA